MSDLTAEKLKISYAWFNLVILPEAFKRIPMKSINLPIMKCQCYFNTNPRLRKHCHSTYLTARLECCSLFEKQTWANTCQNKHPSFRYAQLGGWKWPPLLTLKQGGSQVDGVCVEGHVAFIAATFWDNLQNIIYNYSSSNKTFNLSFPLTVPRITNICWKTLFQHSHFHSNSNHQVWRFICVEMDSIKKWSYLFQ